MIFDVVVLFVFLFYLGLSFVIGASEVLQEVGYPYLGVQNGHDAVLGRAHVFGIADDLDVGICNTQWK